MPKGTTPKDIERTKKEGSAPTRRSPAKGTVNLEKIVNTVLGRR
jgi:hypothetical protein